MYIDSTNIYFKVNAHNSKFAYNCDPSEKYYNCENFFSHTPLLRKVKQYLGKRTK